uniref:peroxisome biogenesis factor 1-like n=1 Tax=Styela clava TaxID=7725 RepID=UPI00193A0752|nr:peroxisome biogenesis factor 1-like [Styela clava]
MADNLIFTVQYTTDKSCSVQADLTNWRNTHLNRDNLVDFDVLKLSVDSKNVGYFNLSYFSRSTSHLSDALFINGLYASKIGFNNNMKVSAEILRNVDVCVRAWLEPISVDDWEILELHAEQVEMSLLDQTRVLWPGQVFPLWVSGNVCIYLRTVSLEPNSQCGILMPLTELIIEPKINRKQESKIESHRLKTTIVSDKSIFEHENVSPSNKDCINTMSSSNVLKTSETTRKSLFRRFLRLPLIRKLVQFISYIFYILWHRLLPAITMPFNIFKISSAVEDKKSSLNQSENVLDCIKDFPDKLNLVLRILPMNNAKKNNSLITSYDQAGFVLLDSISDEQKCNCSDRGLQDKCYCKSESELDFGFFLVSLKELTMRKESDNNDSNITSAAESKQSTEAVVRLCVQSMSKFAMIFRDGEITEEYSQSLKMSSVLRRQLGIDISSKVCLKKLKNIPKPASMNIKRIVIRVLDALELPYAITADDLKMSFERWLDAVTSKEHPLPIVIGSIFHVPFRKFLSPSDQAISSDEVNIELFMEKIFVADDKVSSEYFLINADDLSSIELQFVLSQSNKDTALKSLSDVDPKIPHESAERLLLCHQDIISCCLKHSEAVFENRPMPTKLFRNSKPIHPGCVLLTGPSGVGKTTLCKALLRKIAVSNVHAYVQWLSCSNLRGKKPETVKKLLQNITMELEWRQPSALLLDDIDTLLSSFDSPDADRSPSATYTLQLASVFKETLSTLNKGRNRIFIIATANSEHAIHPLILPSHGCYFFSKIMTLQLPDADNRAKILRSILLNDIGMSSRAVRRINFDEIMHATEGFSAKDFIQLTKRAILSSKNRRSNRDVVLLKIEDFKNAISGFTPISLQNANLHKPKKMTWCDVGGLHEVRKQLTEKLIWPLKYAHLYQTAGKHLQSGIMLYGPPGCGKTLLAGVVANECNLNFISVKGPELLSKYIGASEAAVRDLFMRASAAAPCILFFDEFDSIAQKRGHDSTGVTDRVVNQILTHLDGVEPLSGVYVLAATSRPDLIDPALLRPGRLDTHLQCPMPDFEERCDILKSLLHKITLKDDVNIRAIAARCKYFTGADLRALVYDAQLNAIHGYSTNELESTIKIESTEPFSSISPPISLGGFELDEEYSSNGIKSLHHDLKDEDMDSDSSTGIPKVTISDFTKTAKNLVKSIENGSTNKTNSKSNEYKICYGLSSPEYSSSDLHQLDDRSSHSKKSSMRGIYFPSLYSKMEEGKLPEQIRQIIETVSDRNCDETKISFDGADSEQGQISRLAVSNQDIENALESAGPSVSSTERQKYIEICQNFTGKSLNNLESNDTDLPNSTLWDLRRQQRATLA